MPQRCTICDHPKRANIDDALVAGIETPTAIANRFSRSGGRRLARSSVQRHAANHLPASLVKAKEAADVANATTNLAKMSALEADAHRIKERALRKGDARTALLAVRELTRIVELQCKVAGELNTGPSTVHLHVTQSPEWQAIRLLIMTTLARFPDAKAEVIAALGAAVDADAITTTGEETKQETIDVAS